MVKGSIFDPQIAHNYQPTLDLAWYLRKAQHKGCLTHKRLWRFIDGMWRYFVLSAGWTTVSDFIDLLWLDTGEAQELHSLVAILC